MRKTFADRMAALEQARWERLTPLERAYELAERGTPVAQWSDAELNAFCDDAYSTWPELKTMSDEELEALL